MYKGYLGDKIMSGDIYSFGNYTLANLVDPTPWANVRLEYMNIPLALTNNFWTSAQFAPINPVDIQNSYIMPPVPFGLEMYGAFSDPTNYSDGTLRNFDIGLSAFNNKITMESLAHYGINPAKFALGSIKFGNFGTMPKINFTTPSKDNVADDSNTDKSDKAVFERKVKLILECGDYKDEIAEIRKEMKNDYKKGIEKLDELMKEIDSDKLNEAAKKLYEKDRKEKSTSADKIADQWADKMINATPGNDFKVNTSSLTKDNVLDVIESYILNEHFPEYGKSNMWTSLISNNYEAISKALYKKADDLKKNASEEDKKKIDDAINDLKNANKALKSADETDNDAITEAKTNQANECFELFKTLRGIQVLANDTNAAERYGVPSDKADTNITSAKDKFDDVLKKWNETPAIKVGS